MANGESSTHASLLRAGVSAPFVVVATTKVTKRRRMSASLQGRKTVSIMLPRLPVLVATNSNGAWCAEAVR